MRDPQLSLSRTILGALEHAGIAADLHGPIAAALKTAAPSELLGDQRQLVEKLKAAGVAKMGQRLKAATFIREALSDDPPTPDVVAVEVADDGQTGSFWQQIAAASAASTAAEAADVVIGGLGADPDWWIEDEEDCSAPTADFTPPLGPARPVTPPLAAEAASAGPAAEAGKAPPPLSFEARPAEP